MQLLCAFSLVLALIPGSQAAGTKPAAKAPAAPAAAAAVKGGRTVNLTGGSPWRTTSCCSR